MQLKEVQDRSYELLCLIDDICRKENVLYFLDGGTELGAVREKNIIPWDDDIDIKIFLKDYPAFCSAMEKNLPENIRLVKPEDFAPAFYDFIPRIIDTRYPLRKETDADRAYRNYQNRIGIDVFLIFGVPSGRLRQKCARARLKLIFCLGMSHRYSLDRSKYSWAERTVLAVAGWIGKLIPAKNVCRHYFHVISRYDRKPRLLGWRNNMAKLSLTKMEWTEGTVQAELRGRSFPVPSGYHEELTVYYGDYMKPPKDRSVFVQHLDEEDRFRETAEPEPSAEKKAKEGQKE